MVETTIEPATAARFADAQHAMSGGGDGHACQCQWWTLTNAEFQRADIDERAAIFRDEVDAGPPPGLVAYIDGEPAGWVRVGPRIRQKRLARTRAYAAGTEHDWDDADVWAVSCFAVRKEHRRSGLNAALLDAAVDYARAGGARIVEAYPVDLDAGGKRSSNELYHGVLSTFLAAGFREVSHPKPHIAVVELDVHAGEDERPSREPADELTGT